MICASCGARIAEKAIICYRCGAPTAAPVAPGPAVRSGRTRSVLIVALIAAAAVAAGVLARACSLV